MTRDRHDALAGALDAALVEQGWTETGPPTSRGNSNALQRSIAAGKGERESSSPEVACEGLERGYLIEPDHLEQPQS